MDAIARIRDVAETVRQHYFVARPEWRDTDSPLKYVAWAREETIAKSLALAEALQPEPNDRVFEIGPGTGYLLYLLRELYDCRVFGCDVPDRPLYRSVHAGLGIDTVTDFAIARGRNIRAFRRLYDLIVATQISWMDDWWLTDLAAFLDECLLYLDPGGRIVLFPNPKALHGVPLERAFARYRPEYLQLPYLGRGVILRRPPHD